MARCTARSKRTGERCKRNCAPGDTVCKFHGAKGGAPLKHGARSKFLPENLLERFIEIQDDEDLTKNRDNIRLIEAMIREKLERCKEDHPAELWASAIALYKQARQGGPKGVEALRQLGKILENGFGVAKAREEALVLMEQQRKHRDSENRRVAMNEANLNLRQANALVVSMKAAVDQEVLDPELRRRIAIRLVGLMRSASNSGVA